VKRVNEITKNVEMQLLMEYILLHGNYFGFLISVVRSQLKVVPRFTTNSGWCKIYREVFFDN
jgi:hypothetical protein